MKEQLVLLAKDKHETYIIDASDKDAALLELFHIFQDNEYYHDLNGPIPWDVDTPNRQVQWYAAAKKGDAEAARKLLEYRKSRGYEYEDDWRFTSVIIPKKRKRT
jgi:hypothetical protein